MGGGKDYQLPENHCLEEKVGRVESLERSVAVTDVDSRRARRRYGCGKEQGGGGQQQSRLQLAAASISGAVLLPGEELHDGVAQELQPLVVIDPAGGGKTGRKFQHRLGEQQQRRRWQWRPTLDMALCRRCP